MKIAALSGVLPNARGEERSDGRVRTMLLLVASVLAIRLGPLASLETHAPWLAL